LSANVGIAFGQDVHPTEPDDALFTPPTKRHEAGLFRIAKIVRWICVPAYYEICLRSFPANPDCRLGSRQEWVHPFDMRANPDLHSTAGGLVVSNPAILGGRPVFAGTRVPVATLFDYLADALSLDYFLESFPSVTREQAVAVLHYGQQQIERELAA
jgi:uncharacterized protein (DUF433 family)